MVTEQLPLDLEIPGEHPAYIPNPDPFADLCHVALHGLELARAHDGATVSARCGRPAQRPDDESAER